MDDPRNADDERNPVDPALGRPRVEGAYINPDGSLDEETFWDDFLGDDDLPVDPHDYEPESAEDVDDMEAEAADIDAELAAAVAAGALSVEDAAAIKAEGDAELAAWREKFPKE